MTYPGLKTKKSAIKIAIVGGGMCGMACAIGLMRAGMDVEIYEAASKFGEIGAGVGLGPNAVRVLRELGILDEVMSRADQSSLTARPFLFISGLESHDPVYDYPVRDEDVGLGILRSAFLDSLVHLVDPQKCHFNKRCVNIYPSTSDSQRMHLTFSDGTEAEANVVLGADGIKSIVRTYVVNGGDPVPASLGPCNIAFTNTIAYRGLVSRAKLQEVGVQTETAIRPLCWIGPSKHIITFPIRGGQVVNIVAFACDRSSGTWSPALLPDTPWVTPRTTEDLLAEYANWGPDVQRILECIESPSVWSIHAVDPPLTSYCNGRVALLGDAAHGMLPHLGAGAGQGLEDALALSKLLGHPQTSSANVEAVLQAYDMVRRPRANMVLAASTRAGDIYETYGPSAGSPEGIRIDLVGIWEPVWHHELQADVEKAEVWLRNAGIFSEDAS